MRINGEHSLGVAFTGHNDKFFASVDNDRPLLGIRFAVTGTEATCLASSANKHCFCSVSTWKPVRNPSRDNSGLRTIIEDPPKSPLV